MDITYKRSLSETESFIMAGFLRDLNADRETPLTLDDYAGPIFDGAIDSWMKDQVSKQANALVERTKALESVAQQVEVQQATAAKLAEIEGRK